MTKKQKAHSGFKNPNQVLSLQHHFNVDHAKNYGLVEAIVLNNIHFWVVHNVADRKNFYDDRTWTYNSIRMYSELFPYLGSKQIRNALGFLIELEILLKANYNKAGYDKTLWYAFNDESEWISYDLLTLRNEYFSSSEIVYEKRENRFLIKAKELA